MAKFGIYIIESLRKNDFKDGKALHSILKLSKIATVYKWVNTIKNFEVALSNFKKSNLRYLHISCHADETGIEIGKKILFNFEIEKFTAGLLSNKRIFLSVCKGANKDLASRMIIRNNAYSLLGMPIKLRFDKAVLFWPSFYHLINEIDNKKMKKQSIIEVVKKCVDLFNIPVNYYGRITNSKTCLRRLKIRPTGVVDNRKIKAKFNQT